MGERRTIGRSGRALVAVGMAAATLSLAPRPASAANIIVVTAAVTIADDGQCTLPEAIIAANSDTASGTTAGECPAGDGFDTITVAAGMTITAPPGGFPDVDSAMQITTFDVTLDGADAGPVPGLTVQSSGPVTLSGLQVRGFAGGGVVSRNGGDLTIEYSWFDGNGTASSPYGGVFVESLDAEARTISIRSSTISNNSALSGSGLHVGGLVSAFVENSTIANNTAQDEGGGIAYLPTTGGVLDLFHVTIAANSAPVGAGIVHSGASDLTVTNSIVADNLGVGGDVDGTGDYTSGGGNVIGDGTRVGDFDQPADLIGQSAELEPLHGYRGATPTMALPPTSPAVDRVTGARFSTIDQRSFPRPQLALPDSGAYELHRSQLTSLFFPCPLHRPPTVGGTDPIDGGETRTIQVTGNCTIPDEATSVVVSVTAFSPLAAGNLRLSAAGVVPNGGVVNFADNGLNNSNTVIVELSPDGQIDLSANGGPAGVGVPLTDVFIDAIAYYSPTLGLDYFPVTPCTVADSRPSQGASGAFDGPFTSGINNSPPIDVVGTFDAAQGGGNTDCGVPAGAELVVVNIVAVNATGPGTIGIPGARVLAFDDLGMNNSVVAYVNLLFDEVARIEAYTVASTHLRVVVLGYVDDAGTGGTYAPVTPCAAFDTRSTEGATGDFAGARVGDDVSTYQITGTIPAAQGGNGGDCGVPSNATAVLINLVAVNSTLPGNLQAYATGTTPTGGVVNFGALTPPMNNSNAVPVPIDATGQMDIRTNAGPSGVGQPTTHIRGIILGYYTD